jgi:hypothetical protein
MKMGGRGVQQTAIGRVTRYYSPTLSERSAIDNKVSTAGQRSLDSERLVVVAFWEQGKNKTTPSPPRTTTTTTTVCSSCSSRSRSRPSSRHRSPRRPPLRSHRARDPSSDPVCAPDPSPRAPRQWSIQRRLSATWTRGQVSRSRW